MTSAILLAAGRGERMRPLTDKIPKPLIPINNKSLIIYHIEKLSKINIKNIIINISYLADEIKNTLGDGSRWGMKITYSYEPDALETGGGIFQALPLLGNKPFLVISSDIYTDYDFGKLITISRTHLILVPNPPYNPHGDFGLEKNGVLSNNPEYTYASMGMLHPELFKNCKPGKFRLAPLLREAIEKKYITGEIYEGHWANIGTLEELQKYAK